MDTLQLLVSFGLICLASHAVGKAFGKRGLPTITGYLFTGAIAGGFVLDLIPSSGTEQLRFVDEISLAVIAFVAGSELFVEELRPRLRSILSTAGGIVAVAFVVLVGAIYGLTGFVSFTQDLDSGARFATALLGAAVLLALSPPSTIAVIREVHARGTFTRTVLGVTVVMDVAIIVVFSVMTSLASPLLSAQTLEASFVGLLLLDLGSALALGLVAGKALQGILASNVHRLLKIAALLAVGYAIYELADWVKAWSTDALGFEIYIEPLLISLIAGFFVTNFTRFRNELDGLLHDVGPVVYVAFFTITGLALKLDLLLAVLPVAIALFAARLLGIAGGSRLGARIANEPPRFRRISWMAFITQAGIALGLAREVAVQFPVLGDAFATLIISVVVINEVVGPLFLKAGLRKAGESNEPGATPSSRARGAVILGVEGQTIALARALQVQGWEVIVADTDAAQVERLAAADVDERHIAAVDDAALGALIDDRTQAVVTVLGDDEANLRALRFASEKHGIQRLVVRPAGRSRQQDFDELGAFVVDPGSAMVALFEQAVTAPQSAALFMHRDPHRVIAQVAVSNPDVAGTPVRNLRLPPDVLLLELVRDQGSIVVSGHTKLQQGDEAVLLADPDSLDEASVRLGG